MKPVRYNARKLQDLLGPPQMTSYDRRHLKALAALFVQVLRLAEKAGLVKLGHVALDGTKINANASKQTATSPPGDSTTAPLLSPDQPLGFTGAF